MGSVARVLAQTLKAYGAEHFFLRTGGGPGPVVAAEPAVVEVMIDKEIPAPVTYYEPVMERVV